MSHTYARSIAVALALSGASSALASATQFGGVLTIDTRIYNTDQQMEFNVGPIPGTVQISGVIGATVTQFTGVTAVIVKSGPLQDYVEFRLYADTLPSISVNTGVGNSDVKVIYDLPSNAASVQSSVSVTGSGGNDKSTFEVLQGAPIFLASWNVQAGNGNNEMFASVQSSAATDILALAMNVRAGSGQDKVEANIVSDAAAVDLDINPNLGSGADSVVIFNDALSTGNFNLRSFASLGDGFDIYELGNVQRGGSSSFFGFVDGGGSSDTLKFFSESPGSMNLTLSGGAGADTIDWFGKGAITGAPRLLGGTGNDVLKLVVDGPQTALPFIDGGTGYDIAIGFGTIVNCEEVN